MQTFLPYPSFERSLRCLDNQRLGKQRVEAMQILNCNQGLMSAWRNHPAVLMWREHPAALTEYYNACLAEWERRGYRNIKLGRLTTSRHGSQRPSWLGSRKFHASHRSNLLRKKPEWYLQFGWKEPDDLPYFWPVTLAGLPRD
jgi:hypothetical protein